MRHERHLLVAALLLGAALAGCAQPAPAADVAPAAAPTVALDPDRPDTAFGDVATGPAAAPDLNATTALAPRLVAGEWWRIRFTSAFFQDAPEVVRVVAAVEPEGYLFGMPHEGWYKEAIAYHAPAFGDVGLDLSYETHNERFEPVRFPLVEGATWETIFATSKMTATVESVDETTATIRFDPPPADAQPTDPVYAALNPLGEFGGMKLTYDARQHEVVKFESPIGTWEVVEHGYDYTGWVTVPRGIHTAIDYGQFLPLTPGEPVVTRTKNVEGGYNRMTILHLVFALGPGAYRVRSVSPNGTEYVTESIAGDALTMRFYEASDPDGAWTLEDVVAGPGGTYTMGMAYHQYDIRLPDGARRSDHNHPVIR
jgi:hypothetical protein